MRLSSSRITALTHRPQQDFVLWDKAGTRPSLDLQFADRKDLIDATTGSNLVDHTRASSGTYVGSDGLIKTATTNLVLRSEEFDDWAKFNTTVTQDATTAPNGTITADLVVGTGAPDSISRTSTIESGATVAFSIYMKRSNMDWVRLTFLNGANEVRAWFNLSTGMVGTVNTAGTGTSASASIQNIGDGWYRCTLFGAIPGATSYTLFNTTAASDASFTRVTGGERYLWGAQLEQSSTVGEYIKTTGTINSAPRFDHDPETGESLGLLVEEQRVNYCLQSEAFDTSPWAASNVTVTANTETSPAATLTADTLAATSANGTVTQPVTTTAIEMTFSVYLKRKTGTGNIDITADGTTWVTQTINDTTWTRCVVTQTAVAGTSNPGVRIVTSGDEVYAWGGQYE